MGKQLDCEYLAKTDFDHKKIHDNLNSKDIRDICEKLKVNRAAVYRWYWDREEYKDVRVPILFVEFALEIITGKKNKLDSINESIKNISDK